MADKSSLYDRLGAKALTAPAAGAKITAGGKPSGAQKKFDIGIYFKSVGQAFNDFFNNKLPYFFKNIGKVLKDAPNWFSKLPNDEKICYGVFLLGNILVIVGVVLFFVL